MPDLPAGAARRKKAAGRAERLAPGTYAKTERNNNISMPDSNDILSRAREVLQAEGQTILSLAEHLDETFLDAARAIYACRGKVVLTGVGKAGIIGQKISATLASTGTLSIYLHPVEALHGDLGRLQRDDVVIALSNSGASREILELLDHIKRRGTTLIAITGRDDSPLSRHADVTLCYGEVREACPLGLAPSVSTTLMLALGDALALSVMEMRDFQPEDYAVHHPGGALGRKFLRVEEVMTSRAGDRLCLAPDHLSVNEALTEAETSQRRSGALVLVNAEGQLSGILTDADLRRAIVQQGQAVLDRNVSELMTREPKRIALGDLASEAEAIFNEFRIDELPVVDDAGRPVGVIDVQDVLGLKTLDEA
jgi:arabinose-5-phosphate isomerase